MSKSQFRLGAALIVFSSVAWLCWSLLGAHTATLVAQEPTEKPVERFDLEVREDLFRGFAGDAKALERGIQGCAAVLATNPKHAEALVWHGSALMFKAGQAFAKNDVPNGMQLWTRSLKEMDEAVKLAPNNVGVRIPRGAVLLAAARNVPIEAQAKMLLRKAKEDWEIVYKQHKNILEKLGKHPRGELLFGLAEAARRTGAEDQAKAYLQKILVLNPDTPYAREAKEWLAKPERNTHNCIGCHNPQAND